LSFLPKFPATRRLEDSPTALAYGVSRLKDSFIIVLAVLLLAVTVDVAALLGWLQMMFHRRRMVRWQTWRKER
jgi:hypothetical protein